MRDTFTSEADVKDIATKYEISPSTLSEWKRDALSGKDIKSVKELGKKLAESEVKNYVLLMVLGKKDLIIGKILSWRLSRTMDVGFCLDSSLGIN